MSDASFNKYPILIRRKNVSAFIRRFKSPLFTTMNEKMSFNEKTRKYKNVTHIKHVGKVFYTNNVFSDVSNWIKFSEAIWVPSYVRRRTSERYACLPGEQTKPIYLYISLSTFGPLDSTLRITPINWLH